MVAGSGEQSAIWARDVSAAIGSRARRLSHDEQAWRRRRVANDAVDHRHEIVIVLARGPAHAAISRTRLVNSTHHDVEPRVSSARARTSPPLIHRRCHPCAVRRNVIKPSRRLPKVVDTNATTRVITVQVDSVGIQPRVGSGPARELNPMIRGRRHASDHRAAHVVVVGAVRVQRLSGNRTRARAGSGASADVECAVGCSI